MNTLKNMFLIFGLLVCIGNHNVNAQLNSNLMPVSNIDRDISMPNHEPLSLMEKDNCAKYKKMKRVGKGLMIGGGGSLVLATILFFGNSLSGFDPFEPEPSMPSKALLTGGNVFTILGVAGLGSGIPLTIIGNRKSKQYCNQKTSSLNLVPTRKGVGLQLSF